MKVASTLAILGAFLFVVACGPQVNHNQAVYVLIDTSGTYVRELNKAQVVVNYLLGTINPGDALAVGRVKSRMGGFIPAEGRVVYRGCELLTELQAFLVVGESLSNLTDLKGQIPQLDVGNPQIPQRLYVCRIRGGQSLSNLPAFHVMPKCFGHLALFEKDIAQLFAG